MKKKSLFLLPLVFGLGLGLVACAAPADPVVYTVTFDENHAGGKITTQEVTSGEVATRPSEPTREGFTFSNWYVSLEKDSAVFDFTTKIEADITVYGKWNQVIVNHNFTFDYNYVGASAPKLVKVPDGTRIDAISALRFKHDFLGWFVAPEAGSSKFNFDTVIRNDVTVYAKWTELEDAGWDQNTLDLFDEFFGEDIPYVSFKDFYTTETSLINTEPALFITNDNNSPVEPSTFAEVYAADGWDVVTITNDPDPTFVYQAYKTLDADQDWYFIVNIYFDAGSYGLMVFRYTEVLYTWDEISDILNQFFVSDAPFVSPNDDKYFYLEDYLDDFGVVFLSSLTNDFVKADGDEIGALYEAAGWIRDDSVMMFGGELGYKSAFATVEIEIYNGYVSIIFGSGSMDSDSWGDVIYWGSFFTGFDLSVLPAPEGALEFNVMPNTPDALYSILLPGAPYATVASYNAQLVAAGYTSIGFDKYGDELFLSEDESHVVAVWIGSLGVFIDINKGSGEIPQESPFEQLDAILSLAFPDQTVWPELHNVGIVANSFRVADYFDYYGIILAVVEDGSITWDIFDAILGAFIDAGFDFLPPTSDTEITFVGNGVNCFVEFDEVAGNLQITYEAAISILDWASVIVAVIDDLAGIYGDYDISSIVNPEDVIAGIEGFGFSPAFYFFPPGIIVYGSEDTTTYTDALLTAGFTYDSGLDAYMSADGTFALQVFSVDPNTFTIEVWPI